MEIKAPSSTLAIVLLVYCAINAVSSRNKALNYSRPQLVVLLAPKWNFWSVTAHLRWILIYLACYTLFSPKLNLDWLIDRLIALFAWIEVIWHCDSWSVWAWWRVVRGSTRLTTYTPIWWCSSTALTTRRYWPPLLWCSSPALCSLSSRHSPSSAYSSTNRSSSTSYVSRLLYTTSHFSVQGRVLRSGPKGVDLSGLLGDIKEDVWGRKSPSGVQGRSPGTGSGGRSPPEAGVFLWN